MKRTDLITQIQAVIFDNLFKKIKADKHQALEIEIINSVVTKEDDIVDDFSSNAADKVASARSSKQLFDTTLKIGRFQTTTDWLNQSNIPEGDYDVTFQNAGQNMFGYTHFKFSVRYLNLGTEYIHTIEMLDGRKFRRANVLNTYGDFEEVTVGGGGGITSIVAGANVTVDNTDPKNPRVSAAGGGNITDYLKKGFFTFATIAGCNDVQNYGDYGVTLTTIWNNELYFLLKVRPVDGAPYENSDVLRQEIVLNDGTTYYRIMDDRNEWSEWTVISSGSTTETAPYVLSGLDAAITTGLKASHTIREAHSFAAADIYLEATTTPTDFDIVVDVKKNGTSIFTTKPKILAGNLHSIPNPVLVTSPTVFNVGDIRTVTVDQIGSTETGKNLVLTILMNK